jgi:hypothetical protein
MEIKRCCVCDMVLYPGEKCYQVKIWIYPEGEEELFEWELPDDNEELDVPLEEGDLCDSLSCDSRYCQDTFSSDGAHEIHLTLCKNCQTRFLTNPSTEANLIFLNLDTMTKIIH